MGKFNPEEENTIRQRRASLNTDFTPGQNPMRGKQTNKHDRKALLIEIFERLDADGTGHVDKIELIKAVRRNHDLAEFFGLPQQIRQTRVGEAAWTSSRSYFEKIFQGMDVDDDRQVSEEEFLQFFKTWAPLPPGVEADVICHGPLQVVKKRGKWEPQWVVIHKDRIECYHDAENSMLGVGCLSRLWKDEIEEVAITDNGFSVYLEEKRMDFVIQIEEDQEEWINGLAKFLEEEDDAGSEDIDHTQFSTYGSFMHRGEYRSESSLTQRQNTSLTHQSTSLTHQRTNLSHGPSGSLSHRSTRNLAHQPSNRTNALMNGRVSDAGSNRPKALMNGRVSDAGRASMSSSAPPPWERSKSTESVVVTRAREKPRRGRSPGWLPRCAEAAGEWAKHRRTQEDPLKCESLSWWELDKGANPDSPKAKNGHAKSAGNRKGVFINTNARGRQAGQMLHGNAFALLSAGYPGAEHLHVDVAPKPNTSEKHSGAFLRSQSTPGKITGDCTITRSPRASIAYLAPKITQEDMHRAAVQASLQAHRENRRASGPVAGKVNELTHFSLSQELGTSARPSMAGKITARSKGRPLGNDATRHERNGYTEKITDAGREMSAGWAREPRHANADRLRGIGDPR